MKKVIVSVIAIFAVLVVATTSFASDKTIQEQLEEMKKNQNASLKENQNYENIESGKVENKNTNLNTDKKNNVVSNKNENLPTTTPHTGIGDYSSIIFIGVFGVSAVYAYKKVKEYNI